MIDEQILAVVEALDVLPRQRRWTSLTYCVLDAVWSIGANYDNVVVPLVCRVAAESGDVTPSIELPAELPPDPFTGPTLLCKYPDVDSLVRVTNGQRTSTRGGILKADAALAFVRILVDHGVTDLSLAQSLFHDDARWERVDAALAAVSRRRVAKRSARLLWMLCGNDDLIKPDRMVLRWLANRGRPAGAGRARDILADMAGQLAEQQRRPVTPWMVDHAIWKAERSRKARS